MKTIATLLMAAMLSLSTITFTSCVTTDVTGTITSAQAWLNNPANQATINAIANTVIAVISVFAAHSSSPSPDTVIGKVAPQFPDVPCGAVAAIAKNPKAYIK